VFVWTALGNVANARGRWGEWAQCAEEALHHARLSAQRSIGTSLHLGLALLFGPTRADHALQRLDALFPDDRAPRYTLVRARLLATLGRFDEAWSLAALAAEPIGPLAEGHLSHISWLAGDHERAAAHLRQYCNHLEAGGRYAILSTLAPELGRMLCWLGRHQEAEPLADLGRELGTEDDPLTQMNWRQTLALVHASRGEHQQAEGLAREAVAIGERTDGLDFQGDAFGDLAEVLAAAGRTEEAVDALVQAVDRYERKNNLAMVAQVRPRLETLRERMPA
jgi:tetratricopeptide (TPR) repeat protein